jgi:hypothetical protein
LWCGRPVVGCHRLRLPTRAPARNPRILGDRLSGGLRLGCFKLGDVTLEVRVDYGTGTATTLSQTITVVE